MASIIPPEFFGLYGIGSSIRDVGEQFRDRKDRKRAQSREELELLAALNPNDRQALLAMAEEDGLIPPGSAAAYVPTAMEVFRQSGWEGLNPNQRIEVGPQLGFQPGETPDLAGRRIAAQTEGAEYNAQLGQIQVDEARAAQIRRQQFETAITSPTFRAMSGLPEGTEVTPGSIEALRLAHSLTGEELDNRIRKARAAHADERELAEIDNLRKRNSLIDFQISQARAAGEDDGVLAWVETISDRTGWMPNLIRAAIDPASPISQEVRNAVLKDISEYQESLRADVQRTIREGNNQAGKTLMNLLELRKVNLDPFGGNDEAWYPLIADAITEAGMPAVVVPGVVRAWRKDIPAFIATGEEVLSYAETTAEIVGEPAEAPTLDANSAAQAVPALIERYGSVEKALKATRENENITSADKQLFIQALTNVQGSEPAPEAPTTSTIGESEPTFGSSREALAALAGRTGRPGRASGAEIVARSIRTVETAIDDLTNDIQTRTDRMIEQQSRGLTVGAIESSIRQMESRVEKLKQKQKELLQEAYKITSGT